MLESAFALPRTAECKVTPANVASRRGGRVPWKAAWGPLCVLHSPAVATAPHSWPSSCGFFPSRAFAGPKRLCGLQALKPAVSLVTLTEPWCQLRVFSPRSVLHVVGHFPFQLSSRHSSESEIVLQSVGGHGLASPSPTFLFFQKQPFQFLSCLFSLLLYF